MKSLSHIDIYGTPFNFTFYNKNTYTTAFGGLLSVVTFMLTIGFALYFGWECYFRTNPKIEMIVETPPVHTLKTWDSKNFTVAWRLEDSTGKYLDIQNYFIFEAVYLKYQRNNENKGMELISREDITSSKCSESIVSSMFREKFSNSEWFCLNFNTNHSIQIGGSWDSSFLNSLEVSLYYCRDDNICSNNDINTLLDQDIVLSLVVPTYYIDKNSPNEPLKQQYNYFWQQLSFDLSSIKRIFMKEVVFSDDQGYLFTSYNTSSLLSLDTIETEYKYINRSKSKKVPLTSLNFYINKEYDDFSRKYLKLQDVAALVGGLMKTIYVVFLSINILYNLYSRRLFIINQFFDFEKETRDVSGKRQTVASFNIKNTRAFKDLMEKKKQDINIKSIIKPSKIKQNKNETKDSYFKVSEKKVKLDEIEMVEEDINKKRGNFVLKTDLSFQHNNYSYLSESEDSNRSNEIQIRKSRTFVQETPVAREFLVNVNYRKINMIKHVNDTIVETDGKFDDVKERIKKIKQKKRQKLQLNVCKYIFCRSCGNPRVKRKIVIYDFASNFIKEKLDIKNYLNLQQNFERFKLLFLNNNQCFSFNFFNRPNLYSRLELQDLKEDLLNTDKHKNSNIAGLVTYYINAFNSRSYTEIDLMLFESLDTNLRDIILEYINDPELFKRR